MDNPIWPGWRTVRLLGTGSFGRVYEIERDLFGRTEKAALKYIRIPKEDAELEELYSLGFDRDSAAASYRANLEGIVSEYALMRDFDGNSNIVGCDDVKWNAHDDGIGWDILIKMQLLTPLLKAFPGEIPVETTVKLGKDLCRALSLCHSRNILHRDIKPQNIFLSKNGDFKLGDFGVARTVEKTLGGTTMTGTPSYMAPRSRRTGPTAIRRTSIRWGWCSTGC